MRAKIADFGVSKEVSTYLASYGNTSMVGTYNYSAPEMFTGTMITKWIFGALVSFCK